LFAREVNLIGLLYRPACVLSLVISSRRGEHNCSQLLGLGHHHIVPGSNLDARPFPASFRAFRMNRVPHHCGWRGGRDDKVSLMPWWPPLRRWTGSNHVESGWGVSLPANHATSSGFVTPTMRGGGAGNQTHPALMLEMRHGVSRYPAPRAPGIARQNHRRRLELRHQRKIGVSILTSAFQPRPLSTFLHTNVPPGRLRLPVSPCPISSR